MVQDSYLCEYESNKLDKSVTNVVKLLEQKNWKIATTESCTGGLLSEKITSVSGASSVFELGVCTYSNRMKHEILAVPNDELEKYGAVSSQVAISMVKGLHEKSGAEVCISVTGIAGPTGGTKETPVGTIYIGFFFNGKYFFRLPDFSKLKDKSRQNLRLSAVLYAFGVIEGMLMEENE